MNKTSSTSFPTFSKHAHRGIAAVRTAIGRKSKIEIKSVKKTSKKPAPNRPFMLSFSVREQILFAKRLSMILRSGMPIMEGLHMLREETHSSSATYIFHSLVSDVSQGQPLSSGLMKFQRVFGDFCINIVKVGETTGTLNENLNYLAEELKRKQVLKSKVVSALVYPAIIIAATFGITIMLTVYIFPKIIPIFQSVKATLPLSTRILIAISSFLGSNGHLVFLGLVIVVIAYFVLLRIRRFHYWMDRLLLRIPLIGKLSQFYNLSNICRTLSLLLRSDVRIIEAIDLVAAGTRNLVYRENLELARADIMKGQKMSTQFKMSPHLYPSLLVQMLSVGETTGNLSSTLAYLSEMYEEDINELTKNLTTLLEPILMIIMGTVVGFIAISIITPIYSITQNLQPH